MKPRFPTLLEASVAFALLGTALAVAPGLAGHDVFITPKLLVLALAALGCALALWRRGPGGPSAMDLALGLYAAAGVASAFVNGRVGARSAGWFALEGAGGIVLYATATLAASSEGRRRVLQLMALGGAVVAAFVIVEALGLSLPWGAMRRPVATLGNRNFVGAWIGIVLPLALVRLIYAPRLRTALHVALLITAVLLARTRSVWLGLLVAGSVLAVGLSLGALRRPARPSRRGLAHAAAALAISFIAAAAIPWPGLHWSESHPFGSSASRLLAWDEGSGLERVRSARIALGMLATRPILGAGPHAWAEEEPRYAHAAGLHADPWGGPPTPSSDVVRIAAETGLAGLFAFAALLVLILRAQLARARRVAVDEVPDALGLTATLIVAASHLVLDAPLFRPATMAVYAVLAGLARPTPERGTPSPARLWRILAAGVAAFALATMTVRTVAEIDVASGSDPVGARREAQRWYPHAERAGEIVRRLAARGRCADAAPELTYLRREAPAWTGPLEIARACALRAGDRETAERLLTEALAIEPHLQELRPAPTRPQTEASSRVGAPEILGAAGFAELPHRLRSEAPGRADPTP